jgi:ribonucleoside-diphosphate reductase alpha chain
MTIHARIASNDNKSKEYAYFDRLHQQKCRDENQTKEQFNDLLASRLASNPTHKRDIEEILSNNQFQPAGRVQSALGSHREVSPFNCSVSRTIEDNIDSIMDAQKEAVKILRLGTGIGYNFSNLRPQGADIVKLQTFASGPISFMKGFNVYASTIASAGHRRGAQMGILNISHPDIEAFIDAKMEGNVFEYFNFSVGVSDAFMAALRNNEPWDLVFGGKVYKTVNAKALWEKITKNAYESAEPGIIFIDRLNDTNNLWYCETIEATNPCAEQPLPPYGLCMLGSLNLMAFVETNDHGYRCINFEKFRRAVETMTEAYDNIFDSALYAIPEHKIEALNKRRIGLGMTGIANAIEVYLNRPSYGAGSFCSVLEATTELLRDTAYYTSSRLARDRGAFPLFDPIKYLDGKFIRTLPNWLQDHIEKNGIRNSHLISYAPCGTISQYAGGVSSGVEPVFFHEMNRKVILKDGNREVKEEINLKDYAWREFGFKGKTLEQCTVEEHMRVGEICQQYCDSAVSKTVNVAPDCSYDEYQKIFRDAHNRGLKGITVYRPTAIRGSVITKAENNPANTSEMNTQSCASGLCER